MILLAVIFASFICPPIASALTDEEADAVLIEWGLEIQALP